MAIHLCGLPEGCSCCHERTSRPNLLLDLAPGGVYLATTVTGSAGALLPHRFTLTCTGCPAIGGLLSVALSFESPRLAVNEHPALWSPDLPQWVSPPRPSSRLTVPAIVPDGRGPKHAALLARFPAWIPVAPYR